jgi:hypothetical protein
MFRKYYSMALMSNITRMTAGLIILFILAIIRSFVRIRGVLYTVPWSVKKGDLILCVHNALNSFTLSPACLMSLRSRLGLRRADYLKIS